MKNQSDAFHEYATDGETLQDFLLISNDAGIPTYISANDGDLTTDGITIEQAYCETEDLTFGHAPADKADFTLVNRNGSLSDFPWGEMSAFIAVKVSDSDYHGDDGKIPEDAICAVIFQRLDLNQEQNAVKFYAMEDGLYRLEYDGTETTTTRVIRTQQQSLWFTSIVLNRFGSPYLVATGDGVCYRVNLNEQGEVRGTTSITPNRHMAQKMLSGNSVSFTFEGTTPIRRYMYVFKKGSDFPFAKYELCNQGVFNVNKPDSLQNMTVRIQDAMSVITAFDVDASDFLGSVTYPITYADFLTALCAYVGFGVDGYSIAGGTYIENEIISSNPFVSDGSYSLRQILAWTAELFAGVAVVERSPETEANVIAIKKYGYNVYNSTFVFHAESIENGSLTYKDYDTEYINTLRLKKTSGDTLDIVLSESSGTIYQVNGNPIADASELNVATGGAVSGGLVDMYLELRGDFGGYRPFSAAIVDADPSLEMCDYAQVFVIESNTVPKYDIYGREIPNEFEDASWFVSPILKRTLRWAGRCFISISADGNKIREIDTTSQPYTNSYAVQYTNKAIAGLNNCYQATGSASSVSITSGTITQIELTTTDAISYGGGFEITSDGGIKVTESGIYKVTGSVYHNISASSAITRVGAYIMAGATFATATEVSSTYITRASDVNGSGSYGIPSKLVNLDANDIVYLAARSAGDTGTAVGNNVATWLLIEKVG